MLIALAFLRKHWRAVAVLVLLAVVFFLGRASVPDQPARVEYREAITVKSTEQAKTETTAKVETKTDTDQVRTVVVYRDRVVKPDGTRHEREIETSSTDTKVREQIAAEAHLVEVREVVREVKVDRRVEVEAPRPQWRVGVLAGLDWRDAHLLPLDPGPPAFGAIVERRIIGGLSVGVWGLHRGPQVGVALTYEF